MALVAWVVAIDAEVFALSASITPSKDYNNFYAEIPLIYPYKAGHNLLKRPTIFSDYYLLSVNFSFNILYESFNNYIYRLFSVLTAFNYFASLIYRAVILSVTGSPTPPILELLGSSWLLLWPRSEFELIPPPPPAPDLLRFVLVVLLLGIWI